MSQETKCNGCGKREDTSIPINKRKIDPTEITLIKDDRMPPEKFYADLCPDCFGDILHNYFGVPAKGQLEVPAFIQPTTQERARAG